MAQHGTSPADRAREPPTPAPPALRLPQGDTPRVEAAALQAAPATGTATVTIPVPVVECRGAPSLTLGYGHRERNGLFGLGVSIDVTAIARETAGGVPRYDDSDVVLGPAGAELTPAYDRDPSSGEWAPVRRTATEDGVSYEVEAFRSRTGARRHRIERWTGPDGDAFWQVRTADDRLSVFGRSPAARVADPSDPARVLEWLIEEEHDGLGGVVRYAYKPEDGGGWNGWVPDGGFAARYPERISYGSYRDDGGGEAFAFEVVFDYGEYDVPAGGPSPVRRWPVRADPLVSCRGGFPVQTLRLCRNLLVVNNLPPAGGPVLSRVLRLEYDEDPAGTRLAAAAVVGYRHEDGATDSAELPALRFEYAPFTPGKAWRTLDSGEATLPPAPLGAENGSAAMLADLYGEGLPGLLATAPDGAHYFPPRGGGVLGAPAPLERFPDVLSEPLPRFEWEDVEGNGHLSLVLLRAGEAGVFFNRNDGDWGGFQPFGEFPPEALSTAAHWVDLSGDGRSDVVTQLPGALRCYIGGNRGFDEATVAATPDGFPVLDQQGDQELVTFADVLGDGMAHCVRVADGRVQVWPNLGYGRFGDAFDIAGAPAFEPGLEPDRILLADFSGSGRADLMLVYADRAELHRNLAATRFAPPVTLPVPGSVDPLDRVEARDVEGSARTCLVVAKGDTPGPTQYLDICGGTWPNLLASCSNGMGASTRFSYRSSTDFYLRDRERGAPWATHLPTPVVVVESVEHEDAVSGVVSVETFAYRDGWFDPVERVFRGFGSVQAQDTVVSNPDVWPFATATAATVPVREASLVRHWYDLGAIDLEADRREQFRGDPDGIAAGANVLAPPLPDCNAETLRQAIVALAGRDLHAEVYPVAPDGSPGEVPLRTEDHSYTVVLVQPAIEGHYAAFEVVPRETVALNYDGVADDPRVEQDAVLEWDGDGNPTRWATVYYPRRKPRVPAQTELRVLLNEASYLHVDEAHAFVAGVAWEQRTAQLGGVTPQGPAFVYGELATGAAAALADPIPYGSEFTGPPQARRYAWSQVVFWNADLTGPAPLGSSGPHGLVHHHQEAVFPDGFAERESDGRVTPAMLAEAGYRQDGGHWWRDDTVVFYAGKEGFYSPVAFQAPFQTAQTRITTAYDEPYWLFAVENTDGYGFSSTLVPDYQAMEPSTVTDENGVVTEGLYDPLARLSVIAQHAEIEGGYRGAMTLANYRRLPPPTPDALVADPDAYLQGAQMFFLQHPARTAGAPAMLSVQAHDWVNDPAAAVPAGTPLVTVTHLDGFGRTLESLERVQAAARTPGATGFAWVSEARVAHDDAGRVLREYLPAWADTPAFGPPGERPCATYAYDALGREVREDLPKGFFTKVERPDAWTSRRYDADDTVKDSDYWRTHIHDPDLPPAERRALEMAGGFSDTPDVLVLDPQGFVVRDVAIEVDEHGEHVERPVYMTVDARGLETSVADARLGPATVNARTVYDMLERPLRTDRAGAGTVCFLHDALDQVPVRWTATGALVRTVFDDISRRPVRQELESDGQSAVVVRFRYGDDPATQTVERPTRVDDQAGRTSIECYDLLGSPARTARRFTEQADGTIDWSDPDAAPLAAATWRSAWVRDARNLVTEERAADGTTVRYAHHATGWLASVAVADGDGVAAPVVTDVAYTAAGQPASATYANGAQLRRDYDPLTEELVACEARRTGDGRRLQALAYTLDPVGNVCSVSDAAAPALLAGDAGDPLEKEYAFDALYRLIAATGSEQDANGRRDYSESFAYDAGGNLTAIAHTAGGVTVTRTFDVAAGSNRAVPSALARGRPVDDFFDAAGNLLALDDGAALAYDWDSHLLELRAAEPGAASARYRYDARGRRARRRVTSAVGATTDMLHVESAYVLDPGSQDGPSFGVLVKAWDDMLLVERAAPGAPPSLRWLVSDRLGSVTLALDDRCEALSGTDYYPYGAPSISVAAGAPPVVDLAFAGKESDPESGLAYFGERYYLPEWGRWLTTDPIGEAGGVNLYEYVGGNPVTDHDPHGLMPKSKRRTTKARAARLAITSRWTFGAKGKKFLETGHGGEVLEARVGKRALIAFRWLARKGNTGKGISRDYPMTSEDFRVQAALAEFKQRVTRSMFRKVIAGYRGLVRGHGIPHADSMLNTPASGGTVSTTVKANYYPELEGWGEVQRKRREMKARQRGVPIVHVNDYGQNPAKTQDGTPIPRQLWFVELTGHAELGSYSASKSYTIKAYHIVYKGFDYESLPKKDPKRDRRRLTTLRVYKLPPEVEQFVRHDKALPSSFKFVF